MSLLDSILRRKQEQEKPKSLLDSILERKSGSSPPEPAQVETSTAFTAPERILGALNPIANVAGMLGQTDPATFGPAMASRFLDNPVGYGYGWAEKLGLVEPGTRAEMRAEIQRKANAAALASSGKTLIKAAQAIEPTVSKALALTGSVVPALISRKVLGDPVGAADLAAGAAGPMAAGVLTGGLAMGATKGLSTAAGMGVRAAASALEGALQGIGDRPDDAKTGALLGGAFGAGGSLIGDAVGAGFKALGAKGRDAVRPGIQELQEKSLKIGTEPKPRAKVQVAGFDFTVTDKDKVLKALGKNGEDLGILTYHLDPSGKIIIDAVVSTDPGQGSGVGRALYREAVAREGRPIAAPEPGAVFTDEGRAFRTRLQETDPDLFTENPDFDKIQGLYRGSKLGSDPQSQKSPFTFFTTSKEYSKIYGKPYEASVPAGKFLDATKPGFEEELSPFLDAKGKEWLSRHKKPSAFSASLFEETESFSPDSEFNKTVIEPLKKAGYSGIKFREVDNVYGGTEFAVFSDHAKGSEFLGLDELESLPEKVVQRKDFVIKPDGEIRSFETPLEGDLTIQVDERGRVRRLFGESPTASQISAMKPANIDLLVKEIKSGKKSRILTMDADSELDALREAGIEIDPKFLDSNEIHFSIRPDSPKADRAAAAAIPGSDAWEKEVFEAKRQGFDLADAQLREKLTRKNPKGWKAAAKADSDSMVYKLKEIANGPLSFVTEFGRYGGISKLGRGTDVRAKPFNVRNLRLSYIDKGIKKAISTEIPEERLRSIHSIDRLVTEGQVRWDQAAINLQSFSKQAGVGYEDLLRSIGRARKTRDWSAVPEEARAIVAPALDWLDKDVSRSLIEEGIAPEKAHAIAYRAGEYLHRDFPAYKDPDWWNKTKDLPMADKAIQRKIMELIESGKVDPDTDLLEAAKGELYDMIKKGNSSRMAMAGTPLFKRANTDVLETTMKQKEISYQGMREEMGREIAADLKEKFGKEVLSTNEIEDALDQDALVNKFLTELPNKNAAKRIDRSYQDSLDKFPELRADSKLLSPLLKDKKERMFRDAIREEDFPEVYRKFLGETDNIESLFIDTVSEIAQLKFQRRLFNRIKEMGLKNGLISLEKKAGYQALSAPGFRGLVEPDKGVTEVYAEQGLHDFLTAIVDRLPDAGRVMAVINAWKLGKTASVGGLSRNIVAASTVNMITGGDWRGYKHLIRGYRAAIGDLNAQFPAGARRTLKKTASKLAFAKTMVSELSPDGTPNGFMKEWFRKIELGIMEGGVGKEFSQVADFAESKALAQGTEQGPVMNAIKTAYRIAGEFLQNPEKAVKWSAHEGKKSAFSWAYGRNVDIIIEEEAAHWSNQTYQTYERGVELARATSRSPILANFASFSVEMGRNQFNHIKEGVWMVNKARTAAAAGDAAQAARWAWLAGEKTAGFIAGTAGLAMASKMVSDRVTGWSKDSYDAFKDVVMYKGDQSQEPIIYDYDKKNHTAKYISMRSLDPFWIEDVITAAMQKPGSYLDKVEYFLTETANVVFPPGAPVKIVGEAVTGRNMRGWVQTGGEIQYDDPVNNYPELFFEGQAGKRAYRAHRNITPTALLNVEDMARSVEAFGLENKVGTRQLDPVQEGLRSTVGIKGQYAQFNAAFRSHIGDEYRKVDVLRRSLRKDLEQARLNPSTRRQAYNSRREEYEKLYGRLTWRVKEMRDLDYSDREIYEMLKNTKANKTIGISAALARNIVYSPEYPLPLERAFTFDFDK